MSAPVPCTRQAALVRADNPSAMTLEGTCSWVLREPGLSGAVVVDPGPQREEHLQALAQAGPIELVLITHRHADHTEGIDRLRELAGAPPVRAALPEHCRGAPPLADGERLRAAGVQLQVLAAPGHTADSLCLVLPQDRTPEGAARPSVLTGDTLLGRGSTVIDHPDGSIAEHLASLERLRAIGASGATGLPGHGPVVPDLAAACAEQIAHRQQRLQQVRTVLARLRREDQQVTPELLARHLYPEVPPGARAAAVSSAAAALRHLEQEGHNGGHD